MNKWGRHLASALVGALLTLPVAALGHEAPGRHVKIHITGAFPCEEDQLLLPSGDFNGSSWSKGWRCVARDNL